MPATGKYPHPQGAMLTRATVTLASPEATDFSVGIYYMKEQTSTPQLIKTVVVEAGNLIGFKPLGGQWMEPLKSLVYAEFDTQLPGMLVIIGFGKPN